MTQIKLKTSNKFEWLLKSSYSFLHKKNALYQWTDKKTVPLLWAVHGRDVCAQTKLAIMKLIIHSATIPRRDNYRTTCCFIAERRGQCLLRGLRRKGKGEVKKARELVDIGPVFNRLHTSLCFDVAGEIKKGWNREPKEREEKEQRDEERKTPKSSTSRFQRDREREVR